MPPVCRLAHRLPMPRTMSEASIVALPYRCEVCKPTMPAFSGWLSGMEPQAISVGTTGIPVSSANSTSRSAASALITPPPATISGRSASSRRSSARSIWARVAARLIGRQRRVRCDVELDLRLLDVDRQVDQHRPGPPGPHQVEGLLERARHLGRFEHGDRHLGHRLGYRRDVDGLEVLLVQLGHGRLPGDAQDRDRNRRWPSTGR